MSDSLLQSLLQQVHLASKAVSVRVEHMVTELLPAEQVAIGGSVVVVEVVEVVVVDVVVVVVVLVVVVEVVVVDVVLVEVVDGGNW